MRPTVTRRPSPLRILRAHVQAKADAVLVVADKWVDEAGLAENLGDAVFEWREARALLYQAEGRAEP